MKALGRIPAAQGIAAMQSINDVVLNPLFMSVFFGAAAGCLVLAVAALVRWHKPGAAYMLGGSLLYLVGTVLVTRVCNVPRNDVLAAVDAASNARPFLPPFPRPPAPATCALSRPGRPLQDCDAQDRFQRPTATASRGDGDDGCRHRGAASDS